MELCLGISGDTCRSVDVLLWAISEHLKLNFPAFLWISMQVQKDLRVQYDQIRTMDCNGQYIY